MALSSTKHHKGSLTFMNKLNKEVVGFIYEIRINLSLVSDEPLQYHQEIIYGVNVGTDEDKKEIFVDGEIFREI